MSEDVSTKNGQNKLTQLELDGTPPTDWYKKFGNSYVCSVCGYTNDDIRGLKAHYGSQHDEPYPWREYLECEVCGEQYYKHPSHDSKYCSRDCQLQDGREGPAIFHLGNPFSEGNYYRYSRWDHLHTTYVHQLVVIANGADPHEVFGGDRYTIDHINGWAIDNRPENLRLMEESKHGEKDGKRAHSFTVDKTAIFHLIDFFTPLGGNPKIAEVELDE